MTTRELETCHKCHQPTQTGVTLKTTKRRVTYCRRCWTLITDAKRKGEER